MSPELQIALLALLYIVATVTAGAMIGIRIGQSICRRVEIPEPSVNYKAILVICIIIGGAMGPISGLMCLLTSRPF
jgi:uncharacterized membrane protein YfcA